MFNKRLSAPSVGGAYDEAGGGGIGREPSAGDGNELEVGGGTSGCTMKLNTSLNIESRDTDTGGLLPADPLPANSSNIERVSRGCTGSIKLEVLCEVLRVPPPSPTLGDGGTWRWSQRV